MSHERVRSLSINENVIPSKSRYILVKFCYIFTDCTFTTVTVQYIDNFLNIPPNVYFVLNAGKLIHEYIQYSETKY